MSDCCCCGTSVQNGGGIAAVAAMAGVGIFIWLNIVAIITFLLLIVAAVAGLTIIGVGGMLFLQKYMIVSGNPDIAARLRHYANTGEVTSPSVVIEGEVIEDDGEAMEPVLEAGYQRRRKAISATAYQAAITHSGIPVEHDEAKETSRPEPLRIRDWVHRSFD